jgi:phage FluMu protein Com
MQIRCYSCKIPITISRQNVNQALNIVHEDDLVHFDFRCPKCKKANRVSKEQLLHAAPGWEYESTTNVDNKKPKK